MPDRPLFLWTQEDFAQLTEFLISTALTGAVLFIGGVVVTKILVATLTYKG